MASSKNELQNLFSTPVDQRDQNWENSFFQELVNSRLNVLSPDPQIGPDNWPYLMVETNEHGTEPASNIIRWLAERGIGLAVNPNKDYPDYVFTFGMIWYFVKTGLFYRDINDSSSGEVEKSFESIQHTGDASEDFLPKAIRKIIRDFLIDQGVLAPKINVISTDKVNYDLCFSLESLGSPPANEHEGIAEALSWFLPSHYSIVLISEKGLPPFFPL
jgi:hypothetical protein